MSYVAIERIHEEGDISKFLFEEGKHLAQRVRERAFEIFENRGSGQNRNSGQNRGSELDDWLQAEHELTWAPESNLVDREGSFEIQVAVPGFNAKDVTVTAVPDAIVVRAKCTRNHNRQEREVCLCEFGERSLFRRFDLSHPIDTGQVTATLDEGVLKVSAAKAEIPPDRQLRAAA